MIGNWTAIANVYKGQENKASHKCSNAVRHACFTCITPTWGFISGLKSIQRELSLLLH